jgi:hypothetical protein
MLGNKGKTEVESIADHETLDDGDSTNEYAEVRLDTGQVVRWKNSRV